jgi:hypothetical protein
MRGSKYLLTFLYENNGKCHLKLGCAVTRDEKTHSPVKEECIFLEPAVN